MAQPGDSALSGITPFHLRPVLGLPEKAAKLAEERLRKRAFPAQPLDADESLENGERLLHSTTVAADLRPKGNRSVPCPCRLHGRPERVPGLDSEQPAVEAPDELLPV